MAKKEEIQIDTDFNERPLVEVPIQKQKQTVKQVSDKKDVYEDDDEPYNCLRNEKVIVRFKPKQGWMGISNPKHVLSGGLAEGAVVTYVVPRLSSGMFVNVLTDKEKKCLEEIMGLEYNALSIYKKENNFWDDSNENGISRVRLLKQDNYFNLADPEDYIRVKILLANKDYIASSLQELEDHPKSTYRFVIIGENDETKSASKMMNTTMSCYKEYGKIEDDKDTLRAIIEIIDGRPTSATSKLEFLQTKVNSLIQNDPKMFLKVATDQYLPVKVLIKKAVEKHVVQNRDNHFYYKGFPLCNDNEEATLNIAAKFLSLPKNQDLKFSIEAAIKD